MMNLVRVTRIAAVILGGCMMTLASTAPASAALDTPQKSRESTDEKSTARRVMICLQDEAITGSRIRKPRKCKTREEWIEATGIDPLVGK